ncbi:GatB/YqeY domain-containing protein [Natranaerofaba carboxydovora]|uniref:GatB/YqeY domain-containing protein n=1 Tax=Natranaerofaba carboxydovora TaxID=2742683 RepID=UPI001F1352B5|nr:GatB/YqeY domain-containing protein [Natranaerofaba carboxydovora]UMZ73081.1 Yqey-like protein [Natranaerofaba carboxydovora]
MGIKDLLNEDMKKAMKEKNKSKLSVIRMLRSEIHNKEINKGNELTEDEINELIFKEVKKLKDSLVDYENSNRDDLVKALENEIAVLEEYLPDKLSEEEIRKIIDEAIDKTGAKTKNDIGKLMKEVMPKVKGKAEGKLVNRIALEQIES